MAIELDIQKNFKGFSLDVRLKGQDGPIGILGRSYQSSQPVFAE